MTTFTTEALSTERRILVRLSTALAALEGKNTNRLGEASRDIIRNAYEAARNEYEQNDLLLCLLPRPTAADGKTIDLGPVRERIAKIEQDIHTLDRLETLPELDAVKEAMDTLRAALIKLGNADRLAEQEALRLGLLPARVNWLR